MALSLISLIIGCAVVLNTSWALPLDNLDSVLNATTVSNNSSQSEELFFDKPANVSNVTFVPKDLIVIRTFIYEIGILTDVNANDTDDAPEVVDEINVRTFQPPKNTSVDWWKAFGNKDGDKPQSRSIAFERFVPLGEAMVPSQINPDGDQKIDLYDVNTEEDEEESEEENAVEVF